MSHDFFYRDNRDSRLRRRGYDRALVIGELVETRGVIATAIALAALTAAATAGGVTAAGAIQAHGASKAADKQTQAANYAADLQSKSGADALAFTKQQAEADYKNQELARRGNYDLNAAHEQRLSTLGQMLGLGPRNIPGYVPSQDPNFAGGQGGPAAPGQSGAAQFIAQYQQSHPVSEGVGPITAALKQAGFNVSPYMYGQTPSNNEVSLNGEKYKVLGGEGGPGAYWYQAGMNDGGGGAAAAPVATLNPSTLGAMLPYRQKSVTPALQMPNTIGQVLR